jgi:catechol 2,3-dioxygenase-like lactoylglutathione lyase family enzyme
MFERYSFVALTTTDIGKARRFWVEQLGFAVTEEEPGHFFIVDAGGLRLCVDLADGEIHMVGGTDPVIGLKVKSVPGTVAALRERHVLPSQQALAGPRGLYAVFRDPDGRAVIVTEVD